MNPTILVKDLPNIGPVLARELQNVGIHTLADLQAVGSAHALYKIRGISGQGCMNMLYALEGAIQQIRWHFLEDFQKEHARKAFERLVG